MLFLQIKFIVCQYNNIHSSSLSYYHLFLEIQKKSNFTNHFARCSFFSFRLLINKLCEYKIISQ